MTDVNSSKISRLADDPRHCVLGDEALRQGIELLFFAYRDFTAEPDAILARLGFGRAHHRVIYFVGRDPGITVNALLATLGITKQSLSRVLGALVRESYITQETGAKDRRQRLLHLTEKGVSLERELTEKQRARMEKAYNQGGASSVDGFRKILFALMDEEGRRQLVQRGKHAPASG
jgi:DNA-binding MarR family transcriptional regulator